MIGYMKIPKESTIMMLELKVNLTRSQDKMQYKKLCFYLQGLCTENETMLQREIKDKLKNGRIYHAPILKIQHH